MSTHRIEAAGYWYRTAHKARFYWRVGEQKNRNLYEIPLFVQFLKIPSYFKHPINFSFHFSAKKDNHAPQSKEHTTHTPASVAKAIELFDVLVYYGISNILFIKRAYMRFCSS